jgi:hypothetical protein
MIFCFVRETKQLTLEELDRKLPHKPPPKPKRKCTNNKPEVFSVPTSVYLKYETKVWLPYFFKRHIMRKQIPKPALLDTASNRIEQVPVA